MTQCVIIEWYNDITKNWYFVNDVIEKYYQWNFSVVSSDGYTR